MGTNLYVIPDSFDSTRIDSSSNQELSKQHKHSSRNSDYSFKINVEYTSSRGVLNRTKSQVDFEQKIKESVINNPQAPIDPNLIKLLYHQLIVQQSGEGVPGDGMDMIMKGLDSTTKYLHKMSAI